MSVAIAHRLAVLILPLLVRMVNIARRVFVKSSKTIAKQFSANSARPILNLSHQTDVVQSASQSHVIALRFINPFVLVARHLKILVRRGVLVLRIFAVEPVITDLCVN